MHSFVEQVPVPLPGGRVALTEPNSTADLLSYARLSLHRPCATCVDEEKQIEQIEKAKKSTVLSNLMLEVGSLSDFPNRIKKEKIKSVPPHELSSASILCILKGGVPPHKFFFSLHFVHIKGR